MLDSFLNVVYVHETREQTEREAVALLKQLPADDLLKIASGVKVAWLEPCGPGGSTSFLEKFRGSPLFEEAMALEQEELQAEMTNVERRKEQRSTQQLEQGLWDMQDQLRIKKRLLELRLAQEEAGAMGAQAGGGATPPLNAAPVPEASAQGAGTPGAESAPVEANKTAARVEPGEAFLDTLGTHAQQGAQSGAGVGAMLGALGSLGQGGTVKQQILRALGGGAKGLGAGALIGGLGNAAMAAPGAAVGSLTRDPLIGAIGGAGAGYGIAQHLGGGRLAPIAAMVSGLSGFTAGSRSQEPKGRSKRASVIDPTIDAWGRELARADFAKAADVIALEQAANEAGAVLAKEGAPIPGALGALGTMATNFIKNPANTRTLVGAGLGAAGGLASGLQKDEHGQRHILGGLAKGVAGGALGGLAGHAVQNIGSSLQSGTPLAPAVKQYGAGWAQKIRDVASTMKPPVAAAPQAAMAPLQAAA